MTMTVDEARGAVTFAVHQIVPDADVQSVDDDADLRAEFELDSLDFLSFIELLSNRAGHRIDEEDYPYLRTMSTCVAYLRAER
jgi:acyl carrier protein